MTTTPMTGPAHAGLPPELRTRLLAVADMLIPAAHGMPSAADVIGTGHQLEFVLDARPDLLNPLERALRSLRDANATQLEQLAESDPIAHSALVLVIVAGYYTDTTVRKRIGYPGQVAKPVNALDYPEYLTEGLIDRVLERGPIWRDPTATME